MTATTDPDLISTTIPASTMANLNLNDLNEMVRMIESAADTVAPGGSDSGSVNVGAPGDSQVVVVDGDFNLNDNGAGILLVKGELTFAGNIDFDGIIFVIGEGSMVRNGGGVGNINGGIMVANTAGPDGIPGNGDDVLGAPTFDTSGGGTTNIHYCSTAMGDALSDVPPRTIAFNHWM